MSCRRQINIYCLKDTRIIQLWYGNSEVQKLFIVFQDCEANLYLCFDRDEN